MCERAFVTSEGHPAAWFWRAIQARNVVAAEAAAFELGSLPLEDALALVYLYAEKRDSKYERAALRYLRRYMDECNPSLVDLAQVSALLAEREPLIRGHCGCAGLRED